MKTLKQVLTILFGIILILSGVSHLIKPESFFPFIPDFLPKRAINILAGIVELGLGVGVFIPRFRSVATFGILLLMLTLLPIHIIDVFKETPAIGSHQLALIRLPVQFVLIVWAWFIYKEVKLKSSLIL